MGPARNGGLGASAGAVLVTAIVAIVVLVMIEIGGGVGRPLFTPSHAATKAQATRVQAATTQPMQSEG